MKHRLAAAPTAFVATLLFAVAAAGYALPCSEYISGWMGGPVSGFLLGTETKSRSVQIGLGMEGDLKYASGDLGGQVTETTTWNEGFYQTERGILKVDCRTYRFLGFV